MAAPMCLALLAAGAGCGDGETDKREVVVYCSADRGYAEPVLKAFEAAEGIKVLPRYDIEANKTVGLVQKIRAEAGDPAADVFWSSEIFYTIRLAREGLLASYTSPSAAGWPSRLVDPQRRWHGFAQRARVIAYHSGRVKGEEAPKRLEDLLEAKWKGRIAMAAPEFGTTGGDVASWFAHYGPRRAEEVLKGLKANAVRIASSNSHAVRMLAAGQVDVCLTDTDDVYAGQRNGWPVAMNLLDQGGDGALVIPNTVALIRGAPHEEEAKALIDFLLSARAEAMLARSDSHNTPVRPSVGEEFPAYAIPRALDVPYGKVADALPEAVRKAGEILR